jgi:hypothetical protein
MGKQLLEMYEEARKIGGLNVQIRLAVMTMLSNTKASEAPDSEENIEKFRNALDIIKNEIEEKKQKENDNNLIGER